MLNLHRSADVIMTEQLPRKQALVPRMLPAGESWLAGFTIPQHSVSAYTCRTTQIHAASTSCFVDNNSPLFSPRFWSCLHGAERRALPEIFFPQCSSLLKKHMVVGGVFNVTPQDKDVEPVVLLDASFIRVIK